MKSLYPIFSTAKSMSNAHHSESVATNQTENLLKKFILRTAWMVALLLFLGGSVWGQTVLPYATAGTYTWTCPPGVTSVTVQAWGGGGAGGSDNYNCRGSSGGGGGAFASGSITVTSGTQYTIVVGGGGQPVAYSNGNAGGDSYFLNTSTVLAKGGGGGLNAVATAGAGGLASASYGTTKWSGGNGGVANSSCSSARSGGGGASSAGPTANGVNGPAPANGLNAGATAPAGGGNGGNGGVTTTNPAAGASPGGGGGGAQNGLNYYRLGGAGGSGRIVLTYTEPACTGTPSPGNTVTSSASVTGGSTVNLSLSTLPSGNGLIYQWQSAPSSTGPWTSFGTSANTQTSPAITSAVNWFRCNVTCGANTGTSTPVQVTANYCVPSSTSVDGSGITNVSFGSSPAVNNTTTTEANNYGNYSAQIGAFAQGSSASVSITFNTFDGGSSYDYNTVVFVDWNNDLDFADAGETVWTGLSAASSPAVVTATFTVSALQAPGNYRMRIGAGDAAAPGACTTGATWTCFEDYTLLVVIPSISTNGTLSAYSACSGSVSTAQSFTVSGTNLGANLVVTAPAGFEVSTTQNGTYTSSVSFVPSSGTVSSQTVWVRLTATAVGSPSGNIAVSSTGGTTQNIAVSGTVNSTPIAVTVTGGAICSGGTITATGGTGGTIYWQGTSSNGTSTSIGSGTTSPAITAAGTYYARAKSSAGCWGTEGSASVTLIPIPLCISAGFIPADASSSVNPVSGTTISWSAVTNATSYDVYFGTDNAPTNIVSGANQSGLSYVTGSLYENTTYYWKIVPKNCNGSASNCPVYSFTTTASCTPPTISSTSNVNINCFNQSTGSITVNAMGGVTGYAYSKDNGTTWQSSNVFGSLSVGSYTIVVKGGDGCIGAPSVVALTQPAAALSVSASGSGSGCEGSTLSLTSSVSGGTSPYSYSWSNAGGLSSGAVANPTATIGSFASHTLTVTDANGCTASSSAVAITNNSPAAPTVVTPAAICQGQSANLNATSSGNSINWYTVSSGGTAIASLVNSGANYSVSPLTTTTYYAEAVVTNAASQTFNFTGANQTWSVPAGVTEVTISAWGAEGGGATLSGNTDSGNGGKGGYSTGKLAVTPGQTLNVYVGGFGASSTSGLAAGGWNGGGSGYASSAAEPGNGGGGASDVRLGGTSLSDRVVVAGGGGGGGEDAGDSKGNGGGLTGTGYSGYDASQTAAGTNGQLGIGASTNLGDGGGGGGGYYGGGTTQSTSIGTDTQGGGGGSGFIGGVTSSSTIDGELTMPNPAGGTMVGNSGNGKIIFTFTIQGCASTRTPVTVTVNEAPTATAGAALSAICQGQTSAAMGGSIGGTATSGTWTGGAGAWTNANNQATATYTAGSSESGTVTLTLTPSGGSCPSVVATKTIVVNALPSVNAGSDVTICNGSSSQLVGVASDWRLNQDFEGASFPPAGWDVIATNASYTWASTSTGISGKSARVAYNYSQNEKLRSPNISLSGLNSASLTFDVAMSYYWSVYPYNNMDFIVKISNNGGASWSNIWTESNLGVFTNYQVYPVTVDLSAYVGTDVILSFEYIGNYADELLLDNVKVSGPLTYQWSASAGLSATNISNPVANPTSTTNYTLTVTSGGCSASDQVQVAVSPTSVGGTASSDQTICSGVTPTALSLTGNTGTIQWQSSTTSASAGFTNITNETGETLTLGALSTTTYYRAVVTSGVCTSANSNVVTITVNAIPSAPVVTVVDNCNGTSTLSTTATGTLLWSTTETTSPITVSTADTYTVTQTANGCTSASGSGVAAPKTTPATPSVSVTNACGLSTLVFTPAANATILWSDGGTSSSTTTSSNTTLTVVQTVNLCPSSAGSGSAVPLVIPSAPVAAAAQNFCVTDNATVASLAYTNVAGNTYTWYDAATAGNTVATSTQLPTATTSYYLSVSGSNGCTSLTRTLVAATESAQALATVSIIGTSACPGGEITFTATPSYGGNSPTYQWYNGGVPILNATGNTYIATGLTQGDSITVKMIPSGSCVTVCPN